MHVRDFTPDDYQILVDVRNAIYPDSPMSPDDVRAQDKKRDPKCKQRRWLVEQDGQVVGAGQYHQMPWAYHPQHFFVTLRVLPEFQGRGVGSALYDTILAALEPFDPLMLQSTAREDHPHALRWLERRGYTLHVRSQRSALDMDDFDPARWAGLQDKLRAEDIVLKTLPELVNDPDWEYRLYELDMAVTPDIPGFDNFTQPGFERWKLDILSSPMLQREAYIVAVHDGQYIGMTNLWGDRASDMIYTGFTAVRREYRRKGVATAMKVRSLAWAKASGCPRVNTDNEENNPMLQINYQLGFRDTPAWMTYRKTIRAE